MNEWIVYVVRHKQGSKLEAFRSKGKPVLDEGDTLEWSRDGYTEKESGTLLVSISAFDQSALSGFVNAMNKPAETIVFKEKKS